MSRPIPFELRPDKSRVVIGTTNQGEDVVLYVTPDRPDAWQSKAFRAGVLDDLLRRNITVYVSCEDKLQKI